MGAIAAGAGAVLGIGGALMGAGKKVKVPEFKKVNVAEEQSAAISGNMANFDKASELASKTTAFDQASLIAQLEKSIPGYQNMISKLSGNIMSDLSGNVNPDVEAALQRSSAGKALGSGVGGGSGAGRALSARDFGITSMQIQNQGFGKALNFMQNQRNVSTITPFSAANMFVTPSQRINLAMSENQSQYNRNMAAAQVAAQPDPMMAAIGGAFTNIGGGLLGGGMSSMMGGGGGGSKGGGGNNSGMSYDNWGSSGTIGSPAWYNIPGNNY